MFTLTRRLVPAVLLITTMLSLGACSYDKTAETAGTIAAPVVASIDPFLASPIRSDVDKSRDKYRHPAETFDFFRLHPDHVIGEYAPGGEWVSRILGRYVDEKGKYVGLFFGTKTHFSDTAKEGIKAGIAKFPADVAAVSGRPATDFSAFSLSEAPEGTKGTFDRIIVMRMLHNMQRWNIADAGTEPARVSISRSPALVA